MMWAILCAEALQLAALLHALQALGGVELLENAGNVASQVVLHSHTQLLVHRQLHLHGINVAEYFQFGRERGVAVQGGGGDDGGVDDVGVRQVAKFEDFLVLL